MRRDEQELPARPTALLAAYRLGTLQDHSQPVERQVRVLDDGKIVSHGKMRR